MADPGDIETERMDDLGDDYIPEQRQPQAAPKGTRATVAELKAHAKQHKIRTEAGLRKSITAEGYKGPTVAELKEALATSVVRQQEQPIKTHGGAAATEPGDRLQADLMDYSLNTDPRKTGGHRYAVVVSDVFSRMTMAKAVKNKEGSTVGPIADQLASRIRSKLAGISGSEPANYVMTTDQGKEFKNVVKDNMRPYAPAGEEGAVHLMKDTPDRNATSVVDAIIGKMKKHMKGEVMENGGNFVSALDETVDNVNTSRKPGMKGLHGSTPEDVAKPGIEHFMQLDDQAVKFQKNAEQTQKKVEAIKGTEHYRAGLTDAVWGRARQGEAKYGNVRHLAKFSGHNMYVETDTANPENAPAGQSVADQVKHGAHPSRTLLKHAQAVHKDSENVKDVLIRPGEYNRLKAAPEARLLAAADAKIGKRVKEVPVDASEAPGMVDVSAMKRNAIKKIPIARREGMVGTLDPARKIHEDPATRYKQDVLEPLVEDEEAFRTKFRAFNDDPANVRSVRYLINNAAKGADSVYKDRVLKMAKEAGKPSTFTHHGETGEGYLERRAAGKPFVKLAGPVRPKARKAHVSS